MITEDDVHRYFWSVALAHGPSGTHSAVTTSKPTPTGTPLASPELQYTASTSNPVDPRGKKRHPVPSSGVQQAEKEKRKKGKGLQIVVELPASNTRAGSSMMTQEKDAKRQRKEAKRAKKEAKRAKEESRIVLSSVEVDKTEGAGKERKKKKKREKVDPTSLDPDGPSDARQDKPEKKKRKKKAPPTLLEQERLDEAEIDELLPSSPVREASPPPPSQGSKKRKRDSSTFDLSASPSTSTVTPTRISGAGYHFKMGETKVVQKPQADGRMLSALPVHLAGTPISLVNKGKGISRIPTWATSTPDFIKKRKSQQV